MATYRQVPGPAPKVKAAVDLSPALHARLAEVAQKRQLPLSQVLREAFSQYVARELDPRRAVEAES